MDFISSVFKRRKANLSKLISFGFEKKGKSCFFKKVLSGSGFVVTVSVSEAGTVSAEVIDPSLNEAYTMHLVDSAAGSFVGKIKSQYKAVLSDIAEKCFEPDVFQSEQAEELIIHVRERYGDELEFLWQKFPDNAVWRHQDSKKWYGAILTVSRRKLGLDSDELVEVIDLRLEPEKLEALVDNKQYFPGWHMNKKNWYTIILDGSLPTKEICSRIDISYGLAAKK